MLPRLILCLDNMVVQGETKLEVPEKMYALLPQQFEIVDVCCLEEIHDVTTRDLLLDVEGVDELDDDPEYLRGDNLDVEDGLLPVPVSQLSSPVGRAGG